MELLDMICLADSAQQVLHLLGAYAESLNRAATIPDWCMQMPFGSEQDVRRRAAALLAVVNATSLRLDDQGCAVAKEALQVFAVAATRLQRHRARAAAESAAEVFKGNDLGNQRLFAMNAPPHQLMTNVIARRDRPDGPKP